MNELNQAIKEYMQEEKSILISPKPCAVFISFYNTHFINEVRNQLRNLLGEFHRIDDYLVKIYPSGDEARNTANIIQKLVDKINKILLNAPFERDWLDKYLEVKSYGISIAYPQYGTTTLEEAAAFIQKKTENRNNDIDSQMYIEASEKAKTCVLNENKDTIVDAWTDFISNNWSSTLTKNEVHQMFSSLFSFMVDMVKGKDFYTINPAQRYHDAVKHKDDLLYNESEHKKEAANAERVALKMKKSLEIDSDVCSRFTDNSDVFERLSEASQFFFKTNSEKYKGQFTVEQNPLQHPFKGTNFFFPTYEKPETLLGKDSVDNTYAQYDSLAKPLTKLASAFTTYLYTYAEIRQIEQFKSSLIELAKNLDTTPYHSVILKLLDDSRPF